MSEDNKIDDKETFKYILKYGELFTLLENHASKHALLLIEKEKLIKEVETAQDRLNEIHDELTGSNYGAMSMTSAEERTIFKLFKDMYYDILEEKGYKWPRKED